MKEQCEVDLIHWEVLSAAHDAIAPRFQDEPGNGEQPTRGGGWPPCIVGELLGVNLSYSDDILAAAKLYYLEYDIFDDHISEE